MKHDSLGWLLESQGRWRARLIREGVSGNGNRWTRAVIEQIQGLVEGKPIHAYDFSARGDGTNWNHWEALRQRLPPALQALLPDRLPGATVGIVRNAVIEERDGAAELWSDVEIDPQASWFQGLANQVRRVGRSLGLSIHVPPAAMESRPHGRGIEPTRVSDVRGFDVVTFPSAGGALIPLLEGLLPEEEPQVKNIVTRLLRFVPVDKRSGLKAPKDDEVPSVKALLESHADFAKAMLEAAGLKHHESTREAVLESLINVEAIAEKSDPKSDPEPKQEPKKDAKPALESKDDLKSGELEKLDQKITRVLAGATKALIESSITEAKLPDGIAKFAKDQLDLRAASSGGVLEAEIITGFVSGLKKSVADDTKKPVLEGLEDALNISFGLSEGDKYLAALEGLLLGRDVEIESNGKKERVERLHSIKHAYQVATGDIYLRGSDYYATRRRRAGALESIDWDSVHTARQYRSLGGNAALEAITTASFPLVLADRMHKIQLVRYGEQTFLWNLVARKESVSDFRSWRFQKTGEFADLATVSENAAYALYADASYPGEEEASLTVTKKGQLMKLTWEMIVNDDTRRFTEFPRKVARAAARTLNKNVWGRILNNSTIYDTTALATAGHGNLTASAISLANLKSMRLKMRKQKDINSREAGRFVPRRVFCGPTIYDQAYELIYSDRKPLLSGTDSNQAAPTARATTIDNQNVPNILRGDYGLTLHEIDYYEDVDNDAYTMTCDPIETDQFVVGFLNGREEPELFLQDMQNVGSFFDSDVMTWKVRHVYESLIVEYRAFQLGIP